MPVNIPGHWITVGAGMRKVEDDFYQVTIASFDSDKDSAPEDCIRAIAAWLRVEAEARGVKVDIGGRLVKTPRQRNSFDCGDFVLMVIEHLSRDIGRALRVIEHGENILPLLEAEGRVWF